MVQAAGVSKEEKKKKRERPTAKSYSRLLENQKSHAAHVGDV